MKEEGLDPRFLVVDVRNRKSIEAAKREVEVLYGHVDLLIPNARINLLVTLVR